MKKTVSKDIDITINRGNLIKATNAIDKSLNSFPEIEDVLLYVELLDLLAKDLKFTNDSSKAVTDNLKAKEGNIIVKDGVEHWSRAAYNELTKALGKILEEEITFKFKPISKSTLKTYPPSMGDAIKIFNNKLYITDTEESNPNDN